MDRRRALSVIGGIAGGMSSHAIGKADEPVKVSLPNSIPIKLDEKVQISVRSAPVKVGERELHIVSIGTGQFYLDKDAHLTAILNAAVAQYTNMEYRIVVAVFDGAGQLLGAAQHDESVSYTRLGVMPTLFREINLDFGISKAFGRAAFAVIAISDRDVPEPR
jgi:hypothetical protein